MFNRKRGLQPVPFTTVVTDLTTCHNTWFHPGVDKCFVPTQYCKRSALKNGLKEEQILVHGLPIRPVFNRRLGPKHRLRKQLGLDKHLPTVLIVGKCSSLPSKGCASVAPGCAKQFAQHNICTRGRFWMAVAIAADGACACGFLKVMIHMPGGGEGMGAIEKTLDALDATLGGACQVVAVCGRNTALMQRLLDRWARVPAMPLQRAPEGLCGRAS